jgi:hypothetical protein
LCRELNLDLPSVDIEAGWELFPVEAKRPGREADHSPHLVPSYTLYLAWQHSLAAQFGSTVWQHNLATLYFVILLHSFVYSDVYSRFYCSFIPVLV